MFISSSSLRIVRPSLYVLVCMIMCALHIARPETGHAE